MAVWMALILAGQEGRTLELHDVRDVAVSFQDFPLPGSKPAGEAKAVVPAALDALCRSLVSPRSTVDLDGDVLKVTATPDEHAQVRRMIELLRRRSSHVVTVEVRLIRTAEPLRKTEGAEVLSEADAGALLKRLGALKDPVLTAPRISAFSGQLSHVRIASQTAYIRDYALTVGKNGTAADPVIDTARTGVGLGLRAVLADAEKEEVLLEDLEIVMEQPRQEKFRQIQTPFGPIEDPELRTHRYAVNPRLLKKGDALLAGPLPQPWATADAPPLWALLSCRVTDPSVEAPKKR